MNDDCNIRQHHLLKYYQREGIEPDHKTFVYQAIEKCSYGFEKGRKEFEQPTWNMLTYGGIMAVYKQLCLITEMLDESSKTSSYESNYYKSKHLVAKKVLTLVKLRISDRHKVHRWQLSLIHI